MTKTTDKEYIEKLRKSYASRKITITILILGAIVILIPVLYYYSQLQIEINALLSNLGSQDRNIANKALEQSETKEKYYIGITVGALLSAAFFTVALLLGNAAQYYLHTKKDALLIKYYDIASK
jgi:hypothetical protein